MSEGSASEQDRLAGVAAESRYEDWVYLATSQYSGRVFSRYWRGGRCLELGTAEGVMTPQLLEAFDKVVCVDGSDHFCELLRERFPEAEVVCVLFEDYEPDGQFDAIVLGHVLEHVEDPVAILRRVREWVAPGGAVYAAVPNAHSLHRQAAVIMGLLKTEDEFTDADRALGHRRVYNPASFRHDFVEAGLRVEVLGGYWLKPLSIPQIDRDWTPEMLEAFMQLGERHPDIAAEIYVVARAE
jgi:2-polyprenyl-3-methyl-5-hydroxy-6-metoxy-1,4-benzoquinol methylase